MAAAQPALACRCAADLSPTAAYQRAEAVVIGEVSAVKADSEPGSSTATITISHAWKKAVSREIRVHTSTTCAYAFREGQQFVLYLYPSRSAGYYTSHCVGNATLAEGGKKIAWLKRNGAVSSVKDADVPRGSRSVGEQSQMAAAIQ